MIPATIALSPAQVGGGKAYADEGAVDHLGRRARRLWR